jgi:predicted outer membrane repeat protein
VKFAVGGATCGTSTAEVAIAAAFAAAVSAADGEVNEVTLTESVVLTAAIVMPEGVSLSVSGQAPGRRRATALALASPPEVELSGNNSTNHFVASADSTLSLSHLTLKYGRSYLDTGSGGGGGGSILNYVGATLVIDSCFFLANSAANGDGGAIYMYGPHTHGQRETTLLTLSNLLAATTTRRRLSPTPSSRTTPLRRLAELSTRRAR